jgi:hypothetical protein
MVYVIFQRDREPVEPALDPGKVIDDRLQSSGLPRDQVSKHH